MVWTEDKEKTETKRDYLLSVQSKGIEYASELSDSLGKDVIDLFGDSFGILSLSRSNSSLLMWSHYTQSHSGFVIGFDDTNNFFHEVTQGGQISDPEPVIYSQTRNVAKQNSYNFQKNMLCQKPLDWAYEQEERIFRSGMDKSRSIKKDIYDNDIILFDLPPESIRAIYIGANAERATKEAIYNAIKKHQLRCTVYMSKMSLTEYKVVFERQPAHNLL